MSDNDTTVAVLEAKVKALEDTVRRIEDGVQQKFDRLEKKLDEALSGRPTWAVTLIITALSTLSTGLTIWTITH